MKEYLEIVLRPFNVKQLTPAFWRGYSANTLTKHFPKFSAWFWRPSKK